LTLIGTGSGRESSAQEEASQPIDHTTDLSPKLIDFFINVQAGSGDVAEAARKIAGKHFGGSWLSLPDMRQYIGVVKTAPDATRRDLQELVGDDSFRQLVDVDNSEADLLLVADQASELVRDELVVSSKISFAENRVVVGGVDPEDARAVLDQRALGDERLTRVAFAPDIEVEESVARGGHAIDECSLGAHAFRVGFGTIFPFAVTAGHCDDSLQHRTDGFPWGTAHAPGMTTVQQHNSGSVDGQIMGWDAFPWEPTSSVEGWTVGDFTLNSVQSFGGTYDQEGAWVCHAGSRTRGVNNCGVIDSTSFTCGSHTNLRSVSYQSTGGDSGATVYGFVYLSHLVPLVGIHEGHCGGWRRYSFIRNVDAFLGVDGWYLN
jgi:hypothetical protein